MTAPRSPLELAPAGSWMDHRACDGADVGLFFPAHGDNLTMQAAKAICAGCEVRAECLAYAMDNNETQGVWGGLSGAQRRRLRSARGRVQRLTVHCHGTEAGYKRHLRSGEEACDDCRRGSARAKRERKASAS